jgi:hypothetical protein
VQARVRLRRSCRQCSQGETTQSLLLALAYGFPITILVPAVPLGAPKGRWHSYEIRRAMFQKFPAFYGQATKSHTQPIFMIVEYRNAQVQFSVRVV